MKMLLLSCGLVLGACGTDGEQAYDDVLPLTGETAATPTILTATGFCNVDLELNMHHIRVLVTASDPGGNANLRACELSIGDGVFESAAFDANGGCEVEAARYCTPGSQQALKLVVLNNNAPSNPNGPSDNQATRAYLTLDLAAP